MRNDHVKLVDAMACVMITPAPDSDEHIMQEGTIVVTEANHLRSIGADRM